MVQPPNMTSRKLTGGRSKQDPRGLQDRIPAATRPGGQGGLRPHPSTWGVRVELPNVAPAP